MFASAVVQLLWLRRGQEDLSWCVCIQGCFSNLWYSALLGLEVNQKFGYIPNIFSSCEVAQKDQKVRSTIVLLSGWLICMTMQMRHVAVLTPIFCFIACFAEWHISRWKPFGLWARVSEVFSFLIIKTRTNCRKNWKVEGNVQKRNLSKASHPNPTAVNISGDFFPIFLWTLLKHNWDCYTAYMCKTYLKLYTVTQLFFSVFLLNIVF